jgi:hypothetical protein
MLAQWHIDDLYLFTVAGAVLALACAAPTSRLTNTLERVGTLKEGAIIRVCWDKATG